MIEIPNKQVIETIDEQGDPKKISEGLRRRKIYSKTDLPSDNFEESIDFSLKHNTVKERVRSILLKDKYARKNDFYLALVYWIKCGFIKMQVDFKDFENITKPESISRCRRELFHEAKTNPDLKWLLNDVETIDKRENLKELNRGYFQDKNNADVAKVIK